MQTIEDIKNKLKLQSEISNKKRTIETLDKIIETFDSCVTIGSDLNTKEEKEPEQGYICANYKEIISKSGIVGLGNFDDIEIMPDSRTLAFFEVETISTIDPIYVTPPLLMQLLLRKAFPFFISTYDLILMCKNISRLFYLRPNIWKGCYVRSFTVYLKHKILNDLKSKKGLEKKKILTFWTNLIRDNMDKFRFKDIKSELKFKSKYQKELNKTILSCIFSVQWFEVPNCLQEKNYIEYYTRILSNDTLYINENLSRLSEDLLKGTITVEYYKSCSDIFACDMCYINVITIYNILADCVEGIKGFGNKNMEMFVSMVRYERNKTYDNKFLDDEKVHVPRNFSNEYSRVIFMRYDDFNLGISSLEDIKEALNLLGEPTDDLYYLNANWHANKDMDYKIKKVTERLNVLNASEVKSKMLVPDPKWINDKIDYHIKERNCLRNLPYLKLAFINKLN